MEYNICSIVTHEEHDIIYGEFRDEIFVGREVARAHTHIHTHIHTYTHMIVFVTR